MKQKLSISNTLTIQLRFCPTWSQLKFKELSGLKVNVSKAEGLWIMNSEEQ